MPTITYLPETRESADFPAIPEPVKAAFINAAVILVNNAGDILETDEYAYIAIETLEGIGFSVNTDSNDSITLEFTNTSDYPVGNPDDYIRAKITRDYSLVIPYSDFTGFTSDYSGEFIERNARVREAAENIPNAADIPVITEFRYNAYIAALLYATYILPIIAAEKL